LRAKISVAVLMSYQHCLKASYTENEALMMTRARGVAICRQRTHERKERKQKGTNKPPRDDEDRASQIVESDWSER